MKLCRSDCLLVVIGVVTLCAYLPAQAAKTIRLRLLDGRTGRIITDAGILVGANHDSTPHGEWVKSNEDGTTTITLPQSATVLQVHATYEDATQYYVNCDGPPVLDTPAELWYSVSDVMTKGLVAADGCVKPKELEKLDITAKPGELVIFVRKVSWHDRGKVLLK
ncbi:MAG TPA: hypothetical protein VMU48_04940 [Terracidiphilus sp.]|nr:hypothetical protein [Terracidiphilus sp.]